MWTSPKRVSWKWSTRLSANHATNEWPANFISIDGNTDGKLGANWALLVKGIGGGYVAKNQPYVRRMDRLKGKIRSFHPRQTEICTAANDRRELLPAIATSQPAPH